MKSILLLEAAARRGLRRWFMASMRLLLRTDRMVMLELIDGELVFLRMWLSCEVFVFLLQSFEFMSIWSEEGNENNHETNQ